jgi:RNA polymerase sigma factor (sigma-70 family)
MDRTPPAWACRIGTLLASPAPAPPGRDRRRAELWQLLHAALFAALRAQAGRIAPVSREDLEDLASAKALELLEQAEDSRWVITGQGPSEVAGFVWRVARNGLVDFARRSGREAAPPEDAEAWDHALAGRAQREAGPMDLTAAEEFVADLGGCLDGLAPRSRLAWYRRAVLERPSRETAEALGLKPPHVDVIVQRAREALGRCMRARGHATSDVHPQAFVLLWERRAPAFADDFAKLAQAPHTANGGPAS